MRVVEDTNMNRALCRRWHVLDEDAAVNENVDRVIWVEAYLGKVGFSGMPNGVDQPTLDGFMVALELAEAEAREQRARMRIADERGMVIA